MNRPGGNAASDRAGPHGPRLACASSSVAPGAAPASLGATSCVRDRRVIRWLARSTSSRGRTLNENLNQTLNGGHDRLTAHGVLSRLVRRVRFSSDVRKPCDEGDQPMKRMTFTVSEAAELLGISRTTAYECVRRGDIASLTLGRRIVITRNAVEQLSGTCPPTSHTTRAEPHAHINEVSTNRRPKRLTRSAQTDLPVALRANLLRHLGLIPLDRNRRVCATSRRHTCRRPRSGSPTQAANAHPPFRRITAICSSCAEKRSEEFRRDDVIPKLVSVKLVSVKLVSARARIRPFHARRAVAHRPENRR